MGVGVARERCQRSQAQPSSRPSLTLDFTGVPIRPEVYAGVLQRLLSDLVSQGYEVLSVTPVAGAILCTAIRRGAARERYYGCEGLTCRLGGHTLDCPNIDKP